MATILHVTAGAAVSLYGVSLVADYGGKPLTRYDNLLSIFLVGSNASLQITDATMLNSYGEANKWYAAVGYGGSILVGHVKLQSEALTTPWLLPYVGLTGSFFDQGYQVPTIDPNGSGLTIAATATNVTLTTVVEGVIPPKPQSPNFPLNF